MFNKSIFPLVVVFLISASFILIFRNTLETKGFDWEVLLGGNLFIYLVTVVSMHLLSKGLHAPNTHTFLRNAYGGIMIKLFACAAAVVMYVVISSKSFNKPSLFACMGLYLLYTYLEFNGILKQSNERKNAGN